jgi:serine phosphatase RsbU (regulator of sigma subunit)
VIDTCEYYDFLDREDERIWVAQADPAGKGVAAPLVSECWGDET